MRLNKLAIATLFGAVLALPAFAQTTPAPAAPMPAKPSMTTTTPHPATTTPAATTPAVTTPINLNTATPDQLDSLPGIGKSRLKKIIAARPYTSVDQLDSKKVIPHSVYEKIKDKVTI